MQTMRVLESLGLPSDSERLYRLLRAVAGLSVDEAAGRLALTPAELVDKVTPLLERGVVTLTGGTLQVLTPQDTVGLLLAQEAEAIRGGVERVASLVESVRMLGSRSGADELDLGLRDRVNGAVVDSVAPMALIESWISETSGDLMFLRPDQWRLPSASKAAATFDKALQQGRRLRTIYPVSALHDARSMLTARAAAGEEIRLLPEVPTRLGIIGDDHALMPEVPGVSSARTIVLNDPGLVAMMAAYFEELWVQGVALPRLAESDAREEWQRLLLSELASGARDEQIARRLGLGLRTVRRRVSTLMLELGAETRFQAGVEAARRGLI